MIKAQRKIGRMNWMRRVLVACLALACEQAVALAEPADDRLLVDWTEQFVREVDHRLDVPPPEQARYLAMIDHVLADANLQQLPTQAFLLVDSSLQVQTAIVLIRKEDGTWTWIGATAVSTGKVGTYDHFVTPLGVFPHSLENPDFRAEGTFNENHIRGYGLRGRRVFDFGWQVAERGWGDGGTSRMRLQMHATDPHVLEGRLGRAASEGCIRIPATLNVFLDLHGVLDADYEAAEEAGQSLWVLKPGRSTIPWPGNYMVIVDSGTVDRPAWSPLPPW